MSENVIPNLVRSNPKNIGFWNFEKQEKATVRIENLTSCYTEGHDKIFSYYGRDLPSLAKWFIGYTAALLNPITGEIFMRDFGRFTFILKYSPVVDPDQIFNCLDGTVDITSMGKEWSRFYGEEDPDLDALILKQVYDLTKE
jgi:hypothetical protein